MQIKFRKVYSEEEREEEDIYDVFYDIRDINGERARLIETVCLYNGKVVRWFDEVARKHYEFPENLPPNKQSTSK